MLFRSPKSKGKKAAKPAPYDIKQAKKASAKKGKNTTSVLFEKKARNFGIGQDIQPKRDLTRFVRWPQYVKLQRQRRVLMKRLKVPPSIHQFSRTVDKNTATALFKLLNKYRPETKAQKKERLLALAAAKSKGESTGAGKKPNVVKFGLNHVTALIEQKKAKLVIISHDVDPIELVVWLPALCRKMDVPYCIVKSKSRVGSVVHQKTATCLAIVDVNKEDKNELATLVTAIKENYNDKYDEVRKQWGGQIMGVKHNARVAKQQRLRDRENRQR